MSDGLPPGMTVSDLCDRCLSVGEAGECCITAHRLRAERDHARDGWQKTSDALAKAHTGWGSALRQRHTELADLRQRITALADRMEKRANAGDNPADCGAMGDFADELRRIGEG